jgi:hypothetical protein
LQHRVNDALSARPETQAVRDYCRCVEAFSFDHAATRGCLSALLKEWCGGKCVVMDGNGWWSVETDTQTWDDDNTGSLTEALVSALEAAPRG